MTVSPIPREMGHRHTVTEEIKMSSYLDALPITNLNSKSPYATTDSTGS